MDYFYAELFSGIGLDWLSDHISALNVSEDVAHALYDKVDFHYSHTTSTLTQSEDEARAAFLAAVNTLVGELPDLDTDEERDEYVQAANQLTVIGAREIPHLRIP